MIIDLNWLHVIAFFGVPMLVALVTARVAHPGVKAITLAILAAASSLLIELYEALSSGVTYDWNVGLSNAVVIALGAIGVHFGITAPTNITGAKGAIQSSIGGGIGGRHAANDPYAA